MCALCVHCVCVCVSLCVYCVGVGNCVGVGPCVHVGVRVGEFSEMCVAVCICLCACMFGHINVVFRL